MAFSKSFPKTIKGSNYPRWEEVFLTDDEGNIIYQWPALDPAGGEWPTSHWPVNYWVQDKVSLPVDAGIPAGEFNLQAVWVAPKDRSAYTNLPEMGYNFGKLEIESR